MGLSIQHRGDVQRGLHFRHRGSKTYSLHLIHSWFVLHLLDALHAQCVSATVASAMLDFDLLRGTSIEPSHG